MPTFSTFQMDCPFHFKLGMTKDGQNLIAREAKCLFEHLLFYILLKNLKKISYGYFSNSVKFNSLNLHLHFIIVLIFIKFFFLQGLYSLIFHQRVCV